MPISVIVPVHNESVLIHEKISYFLNLAKHTQLMFVDGNSTDNTAGLLKQYGFTVIQSDIASRGAQLALGVSHTDNDILVFHHFDTVLPNNALDLISDVISSKPWGRFNVHINDSAWMFRIIELMMNWRSCLTSVATGDQAIFVKRDAYESYVDGIEDLPIMEDVYLSKQLRKLSRGACIRTPINVSSRYWRKRGIFKSIFNMWRFRFLYFIGVSPARLYQMYYSK